MNHYIWGFAPCPNRGGINPTSRSYFWKKNPKNPKKPDRRSFILSKRDSEQGCHTAALFLCSARTVRAATVPTPVRTRIRRAYIACPRIARAPATPPVSSLSTTRTLALTHRAAHTEHRPTHSPRTTRAHSTTRIRRHLPRRHLPAVPPAPARLPAEVWKPQTFSFYQSISNLDVSLPNGREKDVKGLLFRRGAFSPFKIGKAFQTLSSVYQT